MSFRFETVDTTGKPEISVPQQGDFIRFENIPSGNLLTVVTNQGDSALLKQGRSWQVERHFSSFKFTGYVPGEPITLQTGLGWLLDAVPKPTPLDPGFSLAPSRHDSFTIPNGSASFTSLPLNGQWGSARMSLGNFAANPFSFQINVSIGGILWGALTAPVILFDKSNAPQAGNTASGTGAATYALNLVGVTDIQILNTSATPFNVDIVYSEQNLVFP